METEKKIASQKVDFESVRMFKRTYDLKIIYVTGSYDK